MDLTALNNFLIDALSLNRIQQIPWLDLIGLFLLLSGLIIGLGAVTVADMLGMLGKKSPYWCEVFVKTHPVTKALVWLGIFAGILGALIFYREKGLYGAAILQLIIFIPLLLNALYFSLRLNPALEKLIEKPGKKITMPPKLQQKVTASQVISVLTWWSEVFLTVWHLLLQH